MSMNLIIDINKMKKDSKIMLDNLSLDALVNTYYFIKNLAINNYDSGMKILSQTSNNIIEEYLTYLRSQNKSITTIKNYKDESNKFNNYLIERKISINDMAIADIENYLIKRKSRNISNNTYIKLINCIRSFLKFLFNREYIKKDLASSIKIPSKIQTIKEVLSDIEIQKIEEYLEDRKEKYKNENLRDDIIFNLGINCGFRRQEFINLDWEDVNFDECSVKIIKSKGGKNRVVFFNDKLKDLLLKYRKLTGNYSNAIIRGSHGKRLTKCSLQNAVMRIFKESGIYRNNLTTHSLRHTFADRLRRKGTDINTISKLMGHSSIETTAIYLHSNNEDFKKAIL